MINRFSTKAFTIKKENINEADQLVTFYTEDFGKIKIFCKGIRKINSKLKGGIKEFSENYIEFIETEKNKKLVEARNILTFNSIKKKEDKFNNVNRVINLIDFLSEEEKEVEVWKLFKSFFIEIDKETNYKLFFYYFYWKFIYILGYCPSIDICPICDKKMLTSDISFLDRKGFVHYNCFSNPKSVPINTLKLIKFFLKEDIKKIKKIKLENIDLKDLERITLKTSWFFS